MARRETKSERLRVPPPLIKRRIASGRGAMEQPNNTGDGDASLSPRFWLAIFLTGVATGLLGDFLMVILFNTQYLAFGYHSGPVLAAVEHLHGFRRLLPILIGGALGGPAWFLVRRYVRGESGIDESIWSGDGRLGFFRCLSTGVISEVFIGAGASIGREAAPKLMGGAAGSKLADLLGLSPAQRRLVVACGGGAGLGAVYNVPLGGALFTSEILCGSVTLPTILPALACAVVATATGWLYLPNQATYLGVPSYRTTTTLVAWAIVAGPVLGLLSSAYVRLIGWVGHHPIRGRASIVAPLGACAVVGVLGLEYPQLFGNGKDMAHGVFLGAGTLGLLLALAALKPLVTALTLGSGASGGLFTPTLSAGAVLGGALGIIWSYAWPGSPVGAYAMVGAAAVIGASMLAPLTGIVLVLELTHTGLGIIVPLIVATVGATVVSRTIDGYSIYSARLPALEKE